VRCPGRRGSGRGGGSIAWLPCVALQTVLCMHLWSGQAACWAWQRAPGCK
jgi:hypothetical protein